MPVAGGREPIRYEQARTYPMTVAEAWRLLADTDHLNRTIGLPAVDFSPLDGAELARAARARVYGVVPVRWREFPFDWVRERRYAVRREFASGPIEWLVGGIELEPGDDGVTVKAYAHFTPKNAAGKFLWRLGRAPVTGLLEFCDTYLSRRAAGKADPVPVPERPPAVDRTLLDRLFAELEREPVARELIPPLRERILEGSDDQLTSVRAYALADRWQADRQAVLRLLVYAAKVGLFAPRWQLMCPNCRVAKAELGTLSDLPPQFHCDTCGISYSTDVDERVELRFTIAGAVRDTSSEIYCIAGPLRMPHVLAQQLLRSHEERRLELELGEPFLLRTIGGRRQLTLAPAPADRRVRDVRLTYAAGRWVGPHSLVEGETVRVPEGAAVVLHNQTEGPVLAVLEDVEWTRDATTAADAAGSDELRDALGLDAPPSDQGLAVRRVGLLVGSLAPGELETVREEVVRAGGWLVKTAGDSAVWAFPELGSAVETAVTLVRGHELKAGLHHGPAVATATNGRLDYVGRTANLAAWLKDQSRPGALVVLAATADELELAARDDVALESFSARLRDSGETELVRVSPR